MPMTLGWFLLGLLVGAAAVAVLILPRLRSAIESAHERQLAELRAATEEQIALVTGNREQLADQMKAIPADTLGHVLEQVEKLAAAQRQADRATAAGELGKRTEEIKRSLDPIAQNLR